MAMVPVGPDASTPVADRPADEHPPHWQFAESYDRHCARPVLGSTYTGMKLLSLGDQTQKKPMADSVEEAGGGGGRRGQCGRGEWESGWRGGASSTLRKRSRRGPGGSNSSGTWENSSGGDHQIIMFVPVAWVRGPLRFRLTPLKIMYFLPWCG